jgi:hypothetical protein
VFEMINRALRNGEGFDMKGGKDEALPDKTD